MARPRRVVLHPRLGEFRQREGLTQDQVAERVGISAEMVRKHERGLNLPIKLYRQRYCEVYRATEEQLGLRPGPGLAQARVRLGVLVRQRHWTYQRFCREYDRAAKVVDPKLEGSYPSRAQLHRWLTGGVKGLPYGDHCLILEQLFPGWSVEQLFERVTPDDGVTTTPAPSAEVAQPDGEQLDRVSNTPSGPESANEFVTALLEVLSNGTRLIIGVEPTSAVTSAPTLSLVSERSGRWTE